MNGPLTRNQNSETARQRDLSTATDEIIGINNGLRLVFELISSVASTESTVLISGETGTGKELIASAVHARSGHNSLLKLFLRSPIIDIPPVMLEEVRDIILNMQKEFRDDLAFRSHILRRYFRILLIYLNRLIEDGDSPLIQSKEIDLVTSYLNMVEKNFNKKKLVADYAEMLSITRNSLNVIVKKITGFSARYHIWERVVLEAKRMSRYSDAGIKEISYSLGFLDIAHFSKFFKAVSGANFSAFKKEGLNISLFNSFHRA